MRNKNDTKISTESIAETLKSIVGEIEIENLARQSGFLRRKRTLVPYAFILALLSALGVGKANWIADILRAYNALTGLSLQYKPFHNQLKKCQFPIWIKEVLEHALLQLTLKILEPLPQSKLQMFDDILMHDGTSFAVKASLKKHFPGRFKKSSPAAVELHVTMSGLNGTPQFITLTPDKDAERHYRPSSPKPNELPGA